MLLEIKEASVFMFIEVIPTQRSFWDNPTRKIRVAAYCRVSTLSEEQLESYDEQYKHYFRKINSNPKWELVGVFGDIGISGLGIEQRDEFNNMIALARKGKIDLIITKSIARFSRNTLDTLKIIRDLRERNIGIMFEAENINTLDKDDEVYLEFMSGFAQEQSRIISENIKWGYKAKFKRGEIFTKYRNFMGYTCEDDKLVIVPEEAVIVQKIFQLYIEGKSLNQIKEYLEENRIKTVTGKDEWQTTTIDRMLSNEKYMGDTMLQKTCSLNFPSKKRTKNDGIEEAYYIKDSHLAIVKKEVFNKAQEEKEKRARLIIKSNGKVEISRKKYNSKYLLGNLLVCGHCGASFRRRTERGKVVWRCGTRMEKGRSECSESPTLNEEKVKEKILYSLNQKEEKLTTYDENIIKDLIEQIKVFSLDKFVFEGKHRKN